MATRGLAGGRGTGADMDLGARAGAARHRGAGGSNLDRAHGWVKPGSGNPKREMRRAKKRGANKTAVATVLAEIDLNPAPI